MKWLTLVGLLALSGCSTPHLYVQADAATYRALAPEYKAMVLARQVRGEFTAKDVEIRLRTLKTWALRLRRAGAEVGE